MYEPPRGPSANDQQEIYFALTEATTEQGVVNTLALIQSRAAEDLGRVAEREEISSEEGRDILAAVEAWASVASAVVLEFSLAQGPQNVGAAWRVAWPSRIWPGWRKALTGQLQQVADTLRPSLAAVRNALGASSFSISVCFPWVIEVGLSWDTPQWMLTPVAGTEQMVLEVVSHGSSS